MMLDAKNDMQVAEESTIIVDQYRRSATQDTSGQSNTYNGLRIHTLPGLHEHVAGLVGEYVGSGGAAVDLGAGSGALISRLSDMGLVPTAIDYVEENFQLHDTVKFLQLDLNGRFADAVDDQYEVVTAIEIIEHIENPRHFLREAAKLCKPGRGKIFLTTPNIDNPVSKAFFCRFGTHMWFSDKAYVEDGHITPLSRWQLRKIADEIELDVVYEGSFGDPFLQLTHWLKMRLFARVIQRVSTDEPALSGEIYVAVLEPKE